MKKVLVATCVVAMTAFAVTNASADPVDTARANAYGVNLSGSLLPELIDKEPEVTSVLPPGGLVVEDILTPDVQPVTIAGTGVVVAETSRESTIVPFMGTQQGELSPIAGGGDGAGGLVGGIFDDLLGGVLGGGGGGALPVGALNADDGTVEAQQLGEGLLGGLLGGDLLGGLLSDPEGDLADDEIVIPAANARGFARIEDLNLVTEAAPELAGLDAAVLSLLVDALLEVDVISAEAVAVCAGNAIFFDTAASVLDLNEEPLDVVNTVVDLLGDVIPPSLISVEQNEIGVTDDGTGVFVNALHISVLGGEEGGEGLLGGLLGGTTEIVPEVPLDEVPLDEVPLDPAAADTFEAQQVGGEEPLLDIIIGHAEVSGNACAAPPPPPTSLVPTGPGATLPVTGGGFGALPALLGVGLLGGAVTAGRLALRARRNSSGS